MRPIPESVPPVAWRDRPRHIAATCPAESGTEKTDALRSGPVCRIIVIAAQRVTPDEAFNAIWNGERYATKGVRPIFVDEPEGIVVVTVYVYYF